MNEEPLLAYIHNALIKVPLEQGIHAKAYAAVPPMHDYGRYAEKSVGVSGEQGTSGRRGRLWKKRHTDAVPE